MSNIDTGGPAFPVDRQTAHGIAAHQVRTGDESAYIEAVARLSHGMTLRDYFAAKALPAMLEVCSTNQRAAEEAYAVADAMLKAREGGAA